MTPDMKQISSHFQAEGVFKNARPLGSGHINDTYLVTYEHKGKSTNLAVQRINHKIFLDPPAVMSNIARVTNHVRQKLLADSVKDISRRVLTIIPAVDSKNYYVDEHGNYWRAYLYIDNGKIYDTPESTSIARIAAQMFGRFLEMLVDIPGSSLAETIPDFHNGPKRFKSFEAAVARDPHNRAVTAKTEIDFIMKHSDILDVLPDLVEKGKIPIRVTHNDTKINNVIFDRTSGEGLCVIDLDTVMPGLILYDFGDMVRTTTCPAAEDEKDFSKVILQLEMFEALVHGFLENTASFITDAEKKHLAFAGKMITFEQAVRFLTDYLAGDTYYKVHYEGQNLDRSKTQLKLVQSIMENEEKMNSIVYNC